MAGSAGTDGASYSAKVDQRLQRLIGLARRAGYVAVGLRATEKSLRRGQCHVVLLAKDASARTSRIVRRNADRMPVISVRNKQVLGSWIGSSPVAVAAITQKELAKAIAEAVSVLSPTNRFTHRVG
jgi:ribosomal protein L7Ae-like RNA K-turn-binding protein